MKGANHMADGQSVTSRKKPLGERITEVDVLNGRARADLVRDTAPDGKIVLHAIRKNAYVHERMFNHGKGQLDKDSFDAAEQFRRQFELAHLTGHFAKLDMLRTSGGKHDMADAVVSARKKAIGALDHLGKRRDGTLNWSADIVWYVIGEGDTLEDWSQRVRWRGGNMDKNRAAGILMASLERLAVFYGFTHVNAIKERMSQRGFAKGVAHLYHFITIHRAAVKKPDEAEALRRLLAEIEVRMQKFLVTAAT